MCGFSDTGGDLEDDRPATKAEQRKAIRAGIKQEKADIKAAQKNIKAYEKELAKV